MPTKIVRGRTVQRTAPSSTAKPRKKLLQIKTQIAQVRRELESANIAYENMARAGHDSNSLISAGRVGNVKEARLQRLGRKRERWKKVRKKK